MAQLTHNTSFDATSILEYRKQLKAISEKMDIPNITINDIIIFAVSRILPKHKYLNAHFLDNKMRFFKHVHMGIAVDTPRGLLVPTLFNADTKSLKQIAAESKELIKSAQEGSINPDLLTGGTFTISNLGVLGIESFTPVINPPQTGILGVNCIVERVRTQNGQIAVYPSMGLSLTYDHRALDGAPASRFLMDLKNALENFPVLLAGD
jgi:pyruvate dehydrogenase E2 component (dihydrolipoamide acetyltransferase)